MRSFLFFLCFFTVLSPLFPDDNIGTNTEQTNRKNKFSLWQTPGHFRGFNVNYWCYNDDCVKTFGDMQDLKKTGANLVKINIYNGTLDWRSPYKPIPEGAEALETMIALCRKVDIYYVIDVRAGPGRRDVAEKNNDTVWKNRAEQQKYAEMLKDYVREYGNDPLFIGLNLMVEPDPLWQEIDKGRIETPQQLENELQNQGIDVPAMFQYFIREIRTLDETLPCIVQNVNYSDPEWWGLMKKFEDPYVVYDVHSYVPYEYSHANKENRASYPGTYWCTSTGKNETYSKDLLAYTIFAEVRAFQARYIVPILLGEFGMQYQQNGGVNYLSDYVDIAKQEGWHFALWNFRSDNPENKKRKRFDPEKWDPEYWTEVESWFK